MHRTLLARSVQFAALLAAVAAAPACGSRTTTTPPWFRDAAQDSGAHDHRAVPPDAGPLADHPGPDQVPWPDQGPDLPQPDLVSPDTWGPCTHPTVVKSCSGAGWCSIPAGCFVMGSPASEPCRSSDEHLHQVTLTHGFWISATEVTQAQHQALRGYNPSSFTSCGGSCPVEMVSWNEAAAYCNALSSQAGLASCYSCSGAGTQVICNVPSTLLGDKIYTCGGYRLPTEAEHEYAHRAGTTTALYSGVISSCYGADANADLIAWYDMNSQKTTHPAAKKLPNAWGLYDMAGNAREWVHDWYFHDLGTGAVTDPAGLSAGTYKVMRGGGWWDLAWFQRAASRRLDTPAFRSKYVGFRCVRRK